MARVDYPGLCDAVKTTLAAHMTAYGWFRDRFDLTGGNLPKAVNISVCFGGFSPSEFDTGGRTRVATVSLRVVVRGKDDAAVEKLLSDAVADIEYYAQPPTLAAPFFGSSLYIDVEVDARRVAVDAADVDVKVTIINSAA